MLGLEFILKFKPKIFRYDYRSKYKKEVNGIEKSGLDDYNIKLNSKT